MSSEQPNYPINLDDFNVPKLVDPTGGHSPVELRQGYDIVRDLIDKIKSYGFPFDLPLDSPDGIIIATILGLTDKGELKLKVLIDGLGKATNGRPISKSPLFRMPVSFFAEAGLVVLDKDRNLKITPMGNKFLNDEIDIK